MFSKESASSTIVRFNSALGKAFEKIDIRLLVFLTLCINLLSFTLSSNEEAYLPLAKQFMDPAWMPNSFLFNEWPGNRILFQEISGFFLRYIDFEPFVFFARMFIFMLIAFPVGSIFRKLEIKNIYAILVFQIYLLHQNYFGQEFIFGDFEAKSISYIFVLSGVYYLLNNRYLHAVLFAAIASYFHILAGGWFFVLLFIYTFFYTKSFNTLLKEFLIFVILFVPYGYYLGKEIVHSGSVINGVNIDWVYVYFRNTHHTAILALKERLPETLLQISVTGLLFLTTIFVFRRFKSELLAKFFILNVIVFSMLFVSLGISMVDKTGFLLKFYLFRIAALGNFLMYLYILLLLKKVPRIPGLLKTGFILIGFYLIVAAGTGTFRQIFLANSKVDYKDLCRFVSQNTSADDVILNLDDYELSFSRITRREEFVVYKYNPGGGEKIYEWYKRIQLRNLLAKDITILPDLKQHYRLDYLLSDYKLKENTLLQLVFRNKGYYLYKIL